MKKITKMSAEKQVEREKIYTRAILKWGMKAQMEMAQEEATELALAIRRHTRKNNDATYTNLIEEIADVEIMIEQIVFMHKDNLIRLDIDRQKEFKINRLKNRLDILDYEIWYSDNEEFINMELAESGADRELDFNPENEFEKRYEKYLEKN